MTDGEEPGQKSGQGSLAAGDYEEPWSNIGTMQERMTGVRILKTKRESVRERVCAFEQLSRPTVRVVFEVVKGPHTRGVLGEQVEAAEQPIMARRTQKNL